MAFLDLNGLNYFYGKLKSKFALSSHGHSDSTTSASGFMSSSDKTKLNGVATGATKNSITQTTVTLTSSGWGSKKQTVTVNGVTASSLVFVTVNTIKYGIQCTEQSSNTLTFTCDTVPTENVTVSVAVLV